MRLKCVTKRGQGKTISRLIESLSGMSCTRYFQNCVGQPQAEQRRIVSEFQQALISKLRRSLPNITWHPEYQPDENQKDRIDIYGIGKVCRIAIEIDKSRADQVAKKFVARSAVLGTEPLIYVSLCVPGTESMNKDECEKYFDYCGRLSTRLGIHYAAFCVDD